MGPKVMVTTTDPFEEATDSGDGHTGSTETGDPKAMDLSSYQQSMDPDHEEEEHDDGNNEGNISGFKKFELPEEAQQAFHKLIQAFTSAGVLQHFDYHLPTRLETDAMAFYSRKMSSAEKNYEIHDKELLAVYRPGDKGGEPDALTRRTDMQPAGEEQDCNVRQLLPPRVFKETADHDSILVAPMISMESIASKGLRDLVKIFQPLDQELQEIHAKKPFKVKDNLWYSGGRLVIPKVIMPGRTNN
ncbi:hypothetical protein NDA10_003045 [Ustilago hordei]|nr:hypothetical protein NDA10_003045 [Ustilago hordei]